MRELFWAHSLGRCDVHSPLGRHCLDVRVFHDAFAAVTAAYPGFFETAHGCVRGGPRRRKTLVDVHAARFNGAGDLFCPTWASPDAGIETISRVVGESDRFVVAVEAINRDVAGPRR